MKPPLSTTGLLLVALAVLGSLAEIAHLGLLTALWIPLSMAAFLILFPLFAISGGASMLEGLFDLDLSPRCKLPFRHFLATLGSFSVAGAAFSILRMVRLYVPPSFGTENSHPCFGLWLWKEADDFFASPWRAIAVLCLLATPISIVAITVSWRQSHARSLGRMIAGSVLALALGAGCTLLLARYSRSVISLLAGSTESWNPVGQMRADYTGIALAFLLTLVFYLGLGWYGWKRLGTPHTVPALVALLMAVLMLGWIGSAAEFFLGRWQIPLLLVIAAGALINATICWADHTYSMMERAPAPAPAPGAVLATRKGRCAIVAASAGGGIQAAAWTAQVLEGLSAELGQEFDDALTLISSISGGSLGGVCYVNWLANGRSAPAPTAAACASSLDEVAWGLAWPDLWRLFFPWPFGKMMDRAAAMERAWQGNATPPGSSTQLVDALSGWNQTVAEGKLPAIIMNATMVEVGGPLLLGTSDVNAAAGRASSGWMDGDQLHQTGSRKMDISLARAARLSASFPYVTPAARPDKANQQPHMIDGGFYDNYGMATLTEWLDQALDATHGQVSRILVAQINGFPAGRPATPQNTQGGWLKQLLAPLTTLMQTRGFGQLSHRDIELQMLKDKWQLRGVEIAEVSFDFDPTRHGGAAPEPPLSWHLMPLQVKAIREMWTSSAMKDAKQAVKRFLTAG